MTPYRFLLPALPALVAGIALAADPAESPSALEKDPAGWTDLLPGEDLAGWKRVPIPPGNKLNAKNPWKVDAGRKVLVCDGAGVHEMLLNDRELADGTFHAEWRFEKVEGKKGYNSGVYARNSADGKVWHQAQVGDRNVGFVFGDTLADGKPKRVRVGGQGAQRGKPVGEWNTYEITCRGRMMTLWINGAVTAAWDDCQVPKGHVGVEAEGWTIEFRNLKFKEVR
jgi:hypothetical protein